MEKASEYIRQRERYRRLKAKYVRHAILPLSEEFLKLNNDSLMAGIYLENRRFVLCEKDFTRIKNED